jgi:arabinogalactan endo-1,4-beta-galactosidase
MNFLISNPKKIALGFRFLFWLLIFIAASLTSCKKDDPAGPAPSPPDTPRESIGFYTGMDLSYQSYLESYDVVYRDSEGNAIDDLFGFVKDNGVDLVRVRLFYDPDPADQVVYHSNLNKVKELCAKIASPGNKILLDFHYSDFWADPGKQITPQAWQGLGIDAVSDSVYAYTRRVLVTLNGQNTLPYMVQIGNETNPGFLWDYGSIGSNYENKDGFVMLVNRAQDAIDEIEAITGETIYSMVHYAGVLNADSYFTNVFEGQGRFDIIGLSHYFLWHSKDLEAVETALHDIAANQEKPLMIVETFYPWTLDWNDWTHNWVGEEGQLIPGYPATPAGQSEYFERMVEMVYQVPGGMGLGIIWWAPDLVAFDGPQSANGSFMENLTTFDFDNKGLPVFDVFRNN